jgi:DNA polymerase-1
LRDEHLYKGRVHSTYHQVRADEHGTISGRLSSSNPNAQNFPSPNKHPEQAKILRSCFVPDDGMKMYEADLSQAEIRMLTYYAKVKTWREGYAQTPEVDAHSAVANAVGIPRQAAKVINLSLSYGAGKDKLASLMNEAGVDGSQAETYLAAYHERLPEIRKFQRQARNAFEDRGFVYSIAGRRYRLANSVPSYTAVNRIIQGATADYIKRALILASENQGGDLLNCIHDSICWQTDDEEYARAIVDAMTERATAYYGLNIPMRADVGNGPNWAECHG